MFNKVFLPCVIALIGLGIAIMSLTGMLNTETRKDFVQGEIDAARVDVAAKFAARIEEKIAAEGASVQKGDLLLKLDGLELKAKVRQADQAVAMAAAQLEKANNGAREEEIRQAETALAEAKAALTYAEISFKRVKGAYDAGAASGQSYDETLAAYRRAKASVDRYQATLDMARAGARAEDKEMAEAQLHQAQGVLAEALATAEDLELKAPVSGEISKVMVHQGELINAGYPLVSLVDMNDMWAVVHVREDMLNSLRMGTELIGMLPALGERKAVFKITYIAPLGDYATWRATNDSGSYDLKSFEIHAKPTESVDGMRPGMSVVFKSEDNAAIQSVVTRSKTSINPLKTLFGINQ